MLKAQCYGKKISSVKRAEKRTAEDWAAKGEKWVEVTVQIGYLRGDFRSKWQNEREWRDLTARLMIRLPISLEDNIVL